MGKASVRKRLRRSSDAPAVGSKGAFGRGIWSQLALMLAALLLLFTALGLLFFSVGPTVYDWSRMRSWQPVSAHVEFAQLHQGATARGGSYYQTLVRHRYSVDGLAYTGKRAVVDPSGDGGGRFHQRLAERLQAAQRTGTPVQVWVNPENPAESVVDRSLRLGPLLWDLGMVVFAGGGSLFMLRMSISALRQERRGRRKRPAVAKSAS